MLYNNITLRGLVLSKYKSISAFASAMGWHRGKATRIINGIQEPNTKEMVLLAEKLEMSQDEFMYIFFDCVFTKCTA